MCHLISFLTKIPKVMLSVFFCMVKKDQATSLYPAFKIKLDNRKNHYCRNNLF